VALNFIAWWAGRAGRAVLRRFNAFSIPAVELVGLANSDDTITFVEDTAWIIAFNVSLGASFLGWTLGLIISTFSGWALVVGAALTSHDLGLKHSSEFIILGVGEQESLAWGGDTSAVSATLPVNAFGVTQSTALDLRAIILVLAARLVGTKDQTRVADVGKLAQNFAIGTSLIRADHLSRLGACDSCGASIRSFSAALILAFVDFLHRAGFKCGAWYLRLYAGLISAEFKAGRADGLRWAVIKIESAAAVRTSIGELRWAVVENGGRANIAVKGSIHAFLISLALHFILARAVAQPWALDTALLTPDNTSDGFFGSGAVEAAETAVLVRSNALDILAVDANEWCFFGTSRANSWDVEGRVIRFAIEHKTDLIDTGPADGEINDIETIIFVKDVTEKFSASNLRNVLSLD
jgi:hypothetical protein